VPVRLVGQNIGPSQPIAPGARIELFFDRLLLPLTVTRQSVVLTDASGNGQAPFVAYDPVARAVMLSPDPPLDPCQAYKVLLPDPSDATDPYGLRAIDGTPLDPSTPPSIEFAVTGKCTGDGGMTAPVMAPPLPQFDFCSVIAPIFQSKCLGSSCHGGPLPAAGLQLDSAQAIADTMINQVSHAANTGPRAKEQPPTGLFGLDMPIVDPGAPGDSWLIYKLLLADPPACSTTDPLCDASAPGVMNDLHSRPWQGISAAERATLSNYVLGRAMPFPAMPAADPSTATEPLTLDELEQMAYWVFEGAPVPACP
jgi:hypothetical protein